MTLDLVGDRFFPTTTECGLFEAPVSRVVDWFTNPADWEGDVWAVTSLGSKDFATAVTALLPLTSGEIRRYVFIPLADWTVMFNNSNLGTDVAMVPSLAARQLGCRALRVTNQPRAPYPAVLLELYDPNFDDILRLRRQIYALNDGGQWSFSEEGPRLPFENVDAYSKRRIKDRFTAETQREYLRHLGIPELIDDNARFPEALLAEKTTPPFPNMVETTFQQ